MAELTRFELGLVDLVGLIRSGAIESDDELERAVAGFAASVPHPRAVDLIFYPDREFGREPSDEEIVREALSYRATELG